MSNSKLVNKTILTSTNYDKGRDGKKIKKITIHHCAGIMSVESMGSFFRNGARQVSAHYGIGNDGRIGQYVDESNTAWTDGNWESNCTSVTIETSNNKTGGQWTVSDNALKSLIKLVADIGYRNNLGTLKKGINVTWHSMYASTACPGAYLKSKMDYIVTEANKINNAKKKTTTTTKPTTSSTSNKSIDTLAKEVLQGKYGNGDARKKALGSLYSKVQARVNEILSGKKTTTTPKKKSIDTIAREVIQGKWGNGADRKKRLEKAGYNYNQVQKRVNQLL
jgi:hypothetical protein